MEAKLLKELERAVYFDNYILLNHIDANPAPMLTMLKLCILNDAPIYTPSVDYLLINNTTGLISYPIFTAPELAASLSLDENLLTKTTFREIFSNEKLLESYQNFYINYQMDPKTKESLSPNAIGFNEIPEIMEKIPVETKIQIVKIDIDKMHVGAKVEVCDDKSIKPGEAKLIPTKNNPDVDFIIKVGKPHYNEKDLDKSIADMVSCYIRALKLATEKGCLSIAFPCIATEKGNFPKLKAADLAQSAASFWTNILNNNNYYMSVYLCTDNDEDDQAYTDAMNMVQEIVASGNVPTERVHQGDIIRATIGKILEK